MNTNISSVLSEYKNKSHRIQNKCILIVNVKEKLSQLVSRRIKELGLKNTEVAKKTGLSRSYIGNMANGTAPTPSGEYNPSGEVVASLAKVLEIPESEILSAMNYLTTDISLPDGLDLMDFDGLDHEDIKEIRDFINFKKMQKTRTATREVDHDFTEDQMPAYSLPDRKPTKIGKIKF